MIGSQLFAAVTDAPLVVAVGWTLVHFLWQGLAIGLLFVVAYAAARNGSSTLRYWLGMAALGAMLAAVVVTFLLVYEPHHAAAIPVVATDVAAPFAVAGEPSWGWLEAAVEPLVPWAVILWLTGVGFNAVQLLGDFRSLRGTLRSAQPLPAPWPGVVDRIRAALGVRRVVRVLESARVGVPIVVGWLKPVIIIPPSALMGLTPRQLELIIGHELAHVARFDYLFNLAQLFVETLLFYHPAVHFVSRVVRLERENCCDDAVVERTGETLAYARALTEIEGLRCSAGLRPAAAATGGDLKLRITRLVAMPEPQRGAAGWLAALTLAGFGLGTVLGGARFAAEVEAPSEPEASVEAVAAVTSTRETATGPADAAALDAPAVAQATPADVAAPAAVVPDRTSLPRSAPTPTIGEAAAEPPVAAATPTAPNRSSRAVAPAADRATEVVPAAAPVVYDRSGGRERTPDRGRRAGRPSACGSRRVG